MLSRDCATRMRLQLAAPLPEIIHLYMLPGRAGRVPGPDGDGSTSAVHVVSALLDIGSLLSVHSTTGRPSTRSRVVRLANQEEFIT